MSTQSKEAIKTALAFALAYAFALKTGWMSPMWVGLTVVVIALPSAGQSLEKGILRLTGTVPGCIAALTIFALSAQSRWMALALTCAWMFFTAYMMLSRPTKAYMWNVAGFTCLIIATGSFESPTEVFERAESRTLATATGIILYTLVTTFLWPRSNAGTIRKALGELLSTQRERFNVLRQRAADSDAPPALRELHLREVQQLAALGQALQAEGSESHHVREIRPELERLRGLSNAIMECLDRLETSTPAQGDLRLSLPGVQAFLDEIDARLASMGALLSDEAAPRAPAQVSLALDRDALEQLPALDQAAVVVVRRQLHELDALTADALTCMQDLASHGAADDAQARRRAQPDRGAGSPALDLDHLRGATLVASTIIAGFLLWVFVNPPGHASWVMLPGVLAMMVAGRQQLSATVFLKPTAIALALGIGIYVFVLPRISTFAELGVVLFASMFVVNYFFKGIGQFAAMIGVLMGISVQQQQAYSFAGAANSYIFTLSSFVLVYVMSYMIQSPRPEKAVLHLVRRFFRSARFLIASASNANPAGTGRLGRWSTAWHRQEIQRLPTKIAAWCQAIDLEAFPDNTPERAEDLVVGLQAVAYRIDELLDAREAMSTESFAIELADDIRAWRARLESTLADWASRPESLAADGLREHLSGWRRELEQRIDTMARTAEASKVDDTEWRRLYDLLGGYRGVSAALLSYGASARQIDWAAWREERFS
jgi:uncharacterized membrane protein YccC